MQVDSPDRIRNLAARRSQRHRQDDARERIALHRRRHQPAAQGRGTQHHHRLRPRGDRAADLDRPRGRASLPGAEHKINLIDCPGYGIFVTETECRDARRRRRLLCVGGPRWRRGDTEAVWEIRGGDRAAGADRGDQDGSRARRSSTATSRPCRRRSVAAAVPVQVPIGPEHAFRAWSIWSAGPARSFERRRQRQGQKVEIPAEVEDAVAEWRGKLDRGGGGKRRVADGAKFFERGTLSDRGARRWAAARHQPAQVDAGRRRRRRSTASAPRRCSTRSATSVALPADRGLPRP